MFIFCIGVHLGVVIWVCLTLYFDQNTGFFRVPRLREAVKSVHTGVHTGIFRSFDPKIHGFAPDSFLTGCVSVGWFTGVYNIAFPENTVFFHIQHLHEATKNMHTSAHNGNFRHFYSSNHCFTLCSFLYAYAVQRPYTCTWNTIFDQSVQILPCLRVARDYEK